MKSILDNCKLARVNLVSRVSGTWGKFKDWGFEFGDLGFQRVVIDSVWCGDGRSEVSIGGGWRVCWRL